jgi:hypothetical protein
MTEKKIMVQDNIKKAPGVDFLGAFNYLEERKCDFVVNRHKTKCDFEKTEK